MKFADHLLRLGGTALSFSTFGLGGLVYGLIIFPSIFLFVRDPVKRRAAARGFIGKGFGAFVEMMHVLKVVDYQIEGREFIDNSRNQLIIANHPTLIDVVILLSLFPQASCVIKEAVTRNPFMRSTVRAANYIPNRQPEDLLDSCVKELAAGCSLLLFPEGTRTGIGQQISFKPGAATVAARAGTDILPIAIVCEPLFLSKQLPWYYVPDTRPKITVRILSPRTIDDLASGHHCERKRRHEINHALQMLIVRELESMAFSGKPN